MEGWESVMWWRRGSWRVSSGIEFDVEGERTKQSSKEGEERPRVKGVFGIEGAEGWVMMRPVGMETESSSRWVVVERVTTVPSMVGEVGLRLK